MAAAPRKTSPSRRSPKMHSPTTAPVCPPIEPLEARMFLSTTTTPTDTLLIRGTNSNDVITLDIRSRSDGTKFARVSTSTRVRDFDLTGINHIRIEALGGDDTVVINDRVVRGIEINAGLGNDSVTGGNGADTVIGGRGNDLISGRDGNDRLRGDTGNDTIDGGSRNDRIDGGDGNDFVTAGKGNDTIDGGKGTDSLLGEDGSDTFFTRDDEMDTVNGGGGSNRAEADLIDVLTQVQSEFTID